MAVFKREMRKVRHEILLETWLTLEVGFAKRPCTVLDMSSTGARISVENPNKIGGRLALALTKDVRKLTPCRVIWQKGNQIGVEFVSR